MPNPDIGRHASAGGKAKARRLLTLERLETELPALDSLEHAMLRLDRVGLWAAAGMLTGSVASAVVRSVEVWVRTHESKLTREVVDQLQSRIADLEAQVRRPAERRGR